MTKLFKNSKQILSVVIAFAIIAVSLFTGVAVISADAATGTIYWDGTVASSFSDNSAGTEGDPIIINTAAELALVITQTEGKYYKIADGIKKIVLQKQSDEAAVMAITDGDNALTVLSGLASPLKWDFTTSNVTADFNGHFDGNGVVIYGLYSYGVTWNTSALFPRVTSNSTFKNVAIRNSVVGRWEGAGLLVGNIGVVSGSETLKFDNIELSNSWVATFHKQGNRAGVLVRGNGSAGYDYNNILTYGCKVYAASVDGQEANMLKNDRLIGIANNDLKPANETDTKYNDFSNSIILGVMPGTDQGNAMHPDHFANVYTDIEAVAFTDFGGYTGWGYNYTDKMITVAVTKGDALKTAMPNLDWDTVWFAGANAPAIRAFHSISSTIYSEGAVYHYYSCRDCDLTSEQIKHTYQQVGIDYLCTVCGHKCLHDGDHGMTSFQSNGDCVTAAGTYTDCPCGYTYYFVTGEPAEGHKFTTHNDADCGDCQNDGTAEHWICEVCNKIFTTDDIWATMDNAVAPEDLNTGRGDHQKITDADGAVIYNNETGHWYKCGVCDGRLNSESNLMAAEEVEDHEFEDGVCTECEWECTHNFEPTGKISVIGDCETDEMSEVQCTICKMKGEIVTKEAEHKIKHIAKVEPTEQMEGTKEHYACDVCQKIFMDAEGKTPAKQASLIIPRTINTNGLSNVIPGENIDTGDKSPSTGEDIMMAIAATVALAGMAFVVIRKAKKA